MKLAPSTDYNQQATHFAKLPEYSIECGTDYLAVKEVPETIRKVHPLKKILDLGCGTGLATRFLKKHFDEALIIGADINKNMLMQAQNADPDGMYIHLNKSDESFLPNTFDVIVCSFVIHENQTQTELENFIRRISVWLRPGGLFLAWDAHKNLVAGKWTTIEVMHFDSPLQDGDKYTVKLFPAGAEVTGSYWSPDTVVKIAAAHQFEQIEIKLPTAEIGSRNDWRDETHLAPIYRIEAVKR